ERIELVLDDQHGFPLRLEFLEDPEESLRPFLVEFGARFVEDHDTRTECERCGDRDTLFLSSREGMRGAIAKLGGGGDLEHLLHPLEQVLAREWESLETGCDLLFDRREDELGI